MSAGITQHITLQLHRDSTFAVFAGAVYDGAYDNYATHPLVGAKVTVGKYETTTDDSGHFRIDIPLADQQEVKPIRIEMQGYKPYEREDESPNKELSYLMFH